MIRTLTLAALLPITVSAAAWANCPTGADLATGIVITDADGGVETLTSFTPSVVVSNYMFDSAEGTQSLLGKGLYFLQSMSIEGGAVQAATRATYAYALPPDELPLPTPGGNWTAQVAAYRDGDISTETRSARFGDLTTTTIGACSYDMIPVTIDYIPDSGDEYSEVIHFLPDLGIGLFAGSSNDEGEIEFYTFLSIEAAK